MTRFLNKQNLEGFIAVELIVVLFIVIILPFVAVPEFFKISKKAKVAAVKGYLEDGSKDCLTDNKSNLSNDFLKEIVDKTELKTYKFSKGNNNKFLDTCFSVRAVPINRKDIFTWFQIDFDEKQVKFVRTCGDGTKIGCSEDKTW